MALTGLEIFKQLPRTNCKECGFPTCLAFAMKVASGQKGLGDCPQMSDEAKAALSEASAPPQTLTTIGAGTSAKQIGQETVLYRHEEKFHRPPGIAVRILDTLSSDEAAERCKAIKGLTFERMGATIAVDMVAVDNASKDADTFTACAKQVADALDLPMVLIGRSADAVKAAGEALADKKPLLYAAGNGAVLDAAIGVAKDKGCPLGIEVADPEAAAELTAKAKQAGVKEMVLSPGAGPAQPILEYLTQTRRACLKKKCRELGYPVLTFAVGEDPEQATIDAASFILKYSGVVVIDVIEPWRVLSILTARTNIYTDPQKPVQVEPGIHTINDPDNGAPLLVTTNFSLSYYSVESEVESARVPARILCVDTEGTSVLTAWAADKFNAETITQALKGQTDLEGQLSHHKVVIPGHVAVLSGSLEDESGWDIIVGPKEASGLTSFLKHQWKA